MSKWKLWKKVMGSKPEPEPTQKPHICVHCGGHVLKQSSLTDFADITGDNQRRLPIEMTERVGMGSKPRKYRGSI
tara:strand:+ start:3224 stop:3448 length:225 start_codon:yes stop_codon:yes gene_type:complete